MSEGDPVRNRRGCTPATHANKTSIAGGCTYGGGVETGDGGEVEVGIACRGTAVQGCCQGKHREGETGHIWGTERKYSYVDVDDVSRAEEEQKTPVEEPSIGGDTEFRAAIGPGYSAKRSTR